MKLLVGILFLASLNMFIGYMIYGYLFGGLKR